MAAQDEVEDAAIGDGEEEEGPLNTDGMGTEECVYYQGLGVFFGKRTRTKLYPIHTTKKDTGLRSSRVSNEELLIPSMQYCGILRSEMVNRSLALQVNFGPQTAVCGWGALEVLQGPGPMLVHSNSAWSGKKAITTRKTLPIPATPLLGCKPLPTGIPSRPSVAAALFFRRRSAAEKVKYKVHVASPRCNSCACFRSCLIPGTRPAAPLWTRQARRGPCPPTSTTVQATRTQEHEDASFLCNTPGRAPAAIFGPGPCLPSHRPPNGNGSAGDVRPTPSRSPVLSTELEREVKDNAGPRDLEGQPLHSSRR